MPCLQDGAFCCSCSGGFWNEYVEEILVMGVWIR